MDPVTTIALATSVIKALGLDEKLGRLIGGDKGAQVAERVVDVATQITGGSPEDLVQAMQADREAAAQIRVKLVEMADNESQRSLENLRDARAMQVAALQQEDLVSKRFVYQFAWAWSLFTMLFIMTILYVPLQEPAQRYADTILGFLLGTVVATLLTFFFGSSRHSKDKDSSIQALIAAVAGMKKGA